MFNRINRKEGHVWSKWIREVYTCYSQMCPLSLAQMPSPVSLSSVDPPFPGVFSDDRIMNPKIAVGTSIQELAQGEPLSHLSGSYQVLKTSLVSHILRNDFKSLASLSF